jgi:hypothetical protein
MVILPRGTKWYNERRRRDMGSSLLSSVIALLLLIHGFAHWNLPSSWGTSSSEHSWLLGRLGVSASTIHTIGMILWMVALLVFLVSGGALFAPLSWWRVLATGAAIIALAMIVLFWRQNLVVGALLDIGVIAALLVANWPSQELLWA